MFILPKALEQGSIFIEDFPLSRLLLKNDTRFMWMILVPRKPNVRELVDLNSEDQLLLLEEINKISHLLKEITHPDKLNIGMIGNIVPELHVHIIARYKTDSLWPQPIWGKGESVLYEPKELEELLKKIREYLQKQ